MDLKGRRKISEALAGDAMRYGADRSHSFQAQVEPMESDFNAYDGEDRSMARFDRVRYLDIVAHAMPHLILESLRNANLLEIEGTASKGVKSPELRLLDISHNGNAHFLHFEDLAEDR